jgi:predicted transcriptional regulator
MVMAALMDRMLHSFQKVVNLPNSENAGSPRDPEAISRFVESFASVLTDAGMPRMPSRVFAALLATDSGRLTAAELASRLQASPAAISGAVRYLTPLNLVSREHEPGSRRDHYRVHDDVWYENIAHRERVMATWESRLREGVAALGPATPAGLRLAETLAFIEFVQAELPGVLERWRRLKKGRRTA